jgi:glycyl-tRNA synthetase beta chain
MSTTKHELFLELGTEELPAAEVMPAVEALRDLLIAGLDAAHLGHGAPRTYATPRRLVVVVPDVEAQQPDVVEELEGPHLSFAFKDGVPTKAAEGFAKKVGLPVEKLGKKTTAKGEVLSARLEKKGQSALALLPELLAALPAKINFTRAMRWGYSDVTFSRPVQWIVSLFGGEQIRFAYGDVQSGRQSRGHRFLGAGNFDVTSEAQWLAELERRAVMPDVAARRAKLVALATAEAHKAGGVLRPDEDLVDEVVQLVEWPVAMLGTFDTHYLEIPQEVLISEMREHQRYFSVVDAAGKLLPHFVVVANTKVEDPEVSVAGYRRVLSARFQDGRFFFNEDQKVPFVSRVERLKAVAYHRALGTTYEKVERVVSLAFWLARELGYPAVAQGDLRALADGPRPAGDAGGWALARAGYLMKADLTTAMVFEFPELQGVMGRAYADRAGEPREVAQAIEDHYLPRNAEDVLPTGELGALLGLADRLDTIAGIFATGKGPTGAADPFGLRRAALGIIRVLRGRGWHLSLSKAIDAAVAGIGAKRKKDEAETKAEINEFVRTRLRGVLTAGGIPADVAEAVLLASADDAVDAAQRAEALAALRTRPELGPVTTAFKRASNILKDKETSSGVVSREALREPAELALFDATVALEGQIRAAVAARQYGAAFDAIATIGGPLDAFFTSVLVMDPDATVRNARLGLIAKVQATFAPLADFRALS